MLNYTTKTTNYRKRQNNQIDISLLICYLLLLFIGVMSVFATEFNGELQSNTFSFKYSYTKQILWASISLLLIFSVLGFGRRALQFFSYPIYILVMLLLLAVLFIGETTKGDQNWINLGFFKLQPSEFAKFATAMALAAYYDSFNTKFTTIKDELVPYFIIGLPLVLVLLQGDAGSAIVFLSFVFVLNRENLRNEIIYLGLYILFISIIALVLDKYIIMAIVFFIFGILIYLNSRNKNLTKLFGFLMIGTILYTSSVSLIFNNVLQKHQRDRINIILGKELSKEAKKGIAFNLNQSLISIGSGGFIGKGYLNGTQTRYNYVPETNTDFIFTAIAEEWGFVGSAFLIGLFVTMLTRLLLMAERQTNTYGRVYIYSVASIIFTHVTINIGMTIGLIPVIGIPLPFISYGGSSLMSFSFMIASALKLDSERRAIM